MNFELVTMPGELWKSIPGFGDEIRVSNFGRIWSLERAIPSFTDPRKMIREHMVRQRLQSYFDAEKRKHFLLLIVVVQHGGLKHGFSVNRLVYESFGNTDGYVEEGIRIGYRDGDNLNNRADNLYLVNGESEEELVSEPKWVSAHVRPQQGALWNGRLSRPIVKYHPDGAVLEEYEHANEAARHNGVSEDAVSEAAAGNIALLNRMVFRYFKHPYNPRTDDYRFGKPVVQYNVEGKKLSAFRTIREAAEFFGLEPMGICRCAHGITKIYHGYIWRLLGEPYEGEYGKMNCTIEQYNMQGKLVARYPGATEAALRMRGNWIEILEAAQGHLKIYEGYAWRFAD